MDWTGILALVMAIPVILFPVAFIGYINGGGVYHALRGRRVSKLTCSIDTDCPSGHACVDGKCVPA